MPIEKAKLNDYSTIKHTIGVMSGKGGVGKSSVTSLIASELNKQGFSVGILDADITGPSIPKVFGLNKRAMSDGENIIPVETNTGIKVISMNLMMDNAEDPVIWRGPVIAGTVIQLYTDVLWGKLDYLLIDMPPGTGDVPLSIMQSVNLDGVIIVSTPQDLVSLIVKKSVNMVNKMNVPVIGLVENMSYVVCSKCGEKEYIFGKGNSEKLCKDLGIDMLDSLPINKDFIALSDSGNIQKFDALNLLSKTLDKVMK
jgi:Mrp family chromosome partitioning ATPase